MAADHDYLQGGLRDKYTIRQRCPDCAGTGQGPCGCRSVGECQHLTLPPCKTCAGAGSVPVDPQAVYFVMRLDADPIARMAALTYAWWADQVNPELARDLRAKIDETEARFRELNPDLKESI